MALKLWLPLIGNLDNKGTGNITVTNNGATVDNNGKIGKCYSFNGNNYYVSLTGQQLFDCIKGGAQPFSVAMWVYHGDSRRAILFGDWSTSNAIGFNIELSTGHALRFYWNGSPDYSPSGMNVGASTWHHVCFTYDGSALRSYLDGVLKDMRSGALGSLSKTAGEFRLGRDNRTTDTALNGKLNDIRVYNHCLTASEIREISKALVIHYKLDSQYETTLRNKYSTPYSDGCSSGGSFTRTQLSNERGYNYTYTYTGNGNNSWPSWCVPNFSFTVGKRYFYSVKVRCNKWTAGSMSLRASRSNNDWVTNSVVICSPSQVDGKWHEYYVSQVVNETYERSGTVTCNPVLEFYCSNLNGNGTLYDFDFDVKDVQVVESDVYIPFIDNGQSNTTVDDCSGFGYNGTIVGTITPSSDTPRNKCSIYNNNNVGAIDVYLDPTWLNSYQTFTANMWIKKISQIGSDWNTIFRYAGSNATGQQLHFCFKASIILLSRYSDDISVSYTIPTNEWIMLTWTGNGKNESLYINGALKQSVTHSNNLALTSSARLSLFKDTLRNAYGSDIKMSDFRMYATTFSADDVYNLYKTEAKVAKYGDLHTYTFSEEDSESISNAGIVKGHTVYECPSSSTLKYDKTIYTEPDGSKWVRIFHHNDPTDYKFSSSSSWKDGVYVDANRWFDIYGNIELAPKYELMLKQKTTSSATEVKYRWIQSVSPLLAVYNDVKPASVTRITTSGYTDGTFGGLYILNSNTHMVIANTSNGNWFGAIGCWNAYNGGIPGYPNTTVTSGYMDLYIRVYPGVRVLKNHGITANRLIER